MSKLQVVVQGTLRPDGTLELDEKPNLPPGRVQVTLRTAQEPVSSGPGWWDVLMQIKREQAARGFHGSSQEEIEAYVRELREDREYEERWQQIWSQTRPAPPAKEGS